MAKMGDEELLDYSLRHSATEGARFSREDYVRLRDLAGDPLSPSQSTMGAGLVVISEPEAKRLVNLARARMGIEPQTEPLDGWNDNPFED